MKKLNIFILTLIIVSVSITGCGTAGQSTGDIQEKEHTNKTLEPVPDVELEGNEDLSTNVTIHEENNHFIVDYKVKNESGNELELTFPSGLTADYIIYNEKGEKVVQYSDDIMATMAIETVTLSVGEELEYQYTIAGLDSGSYTIHLFLTDSNHEASAKETIIVE
ncbi:BsuPI-related putative proteinase inhibitor [Alkalihalobacterium bogoriense]|uniref:BsuPI-related putative proteinase inhibitor n=1 Tax=Alkalihalobacterium bogoriense TaxID=246272 RepID=UPI000478AE4F|nr:BsuPI-related putative proteinase inhibitor [Alkalihalobacterium bogoriense]